MMCKNCGTEFNEEDFCPKCGTRAEKSNMDQSTETDAASEIVHNSHEEALGKMDNDFEREKKVPWYLSIWFIILVSVLTFWLLWIPGIVLGILRLCECKKRRISSVVTLLVLIVPYVFGAFSIVTSIKESKLFDSNIKAGQYEEAEQYIKQNYDAGSYSYAEKYGQLYEAQGLYDEAAKTWLEYCLQEDSLLDVPDVAISTLNGYIENYGEVLSGDTLGQIQTLTKNKELAEAEEQAAKEAKAAEEQAAKEAKAAEEQAAKEVKATQERAEAEEQEAKAQLVKDMEETVVQESEDVLEQDWIEDDVYFEDLEDEWGKDSSDILTQIENSFCSMFDISYQNKKQADKLMKFYKKVLEVEETEFVNVTYEKKSYFKDTYQYKQTMDYSDYRYYGEMKDGLPNGQGCVVRYVGNYGVYLPEVLGNFKKGQLDGYAIHFTNEYTFSVIAEMNYKMGVKDGDYVSHTPSVGSDAIIYMYDLYSSYIRGKKYEGAVEIYGATPIIRDVPLIQTYHNEIGQYDNNKMVGKWTYYDVNNNILVDIKMERNGKKGKGTIYYSAGKKKYEGELKYYQDQLQYHGKGTLYREDGSVEYKGKFKNGEIDN